MSAYLIQCRACRWATNANLDQAHEAIARHEQEAHANLTPEKILSTYPAREFGQVHVLKIDGGWYGRLCEGAKTHEVRRHDRDFQVGDLLRFRIVGDGPSSPLAPRDWLITHVLPLSHVPEANFSASWCVLSLREVPGDE